MNLGNYLGVGQNPESLQRTADRKKEEAADKTKDATHPPCEAERSRGI